MTYINAKKKVSKLSRVSKTDAECIFFFFFFLVNMLKSLSSHTICLYGEERSRELAGDKTRLLSDRAGHDIWILIYHIFFKSQIFDKIV